MKTRGKHSKGGERGKLEAGIQGRGRGGNFASSFPLSFPIECLLHKLYLLKSQAVTYT